MMRYLWYAVSSLMCLWQWGLLISKRWCLAWYGECAVDFSLLTRARGFPPPSESVKEGNPWFVHVNPYAPHEGCMPKAWRPDFEQFQDLMKWDCGLIGGMSVPAERHRRLYQDVHYPRVSHGCTCTASQAESWLHVHA